MGNANAKSSTLRNKLLTPGTISRVKQLQKVADATADSRINIANVANGKQGVSALNLGVGGLGIAGLHHAGISLGYSLPGALLGTRMIPKMLSNPKNIERYVEMSNPENIAKSTSKGAYGRALSVPMFTGEGK